MTSRLRKKRTEPKLLIENAKVAKLPKDLGLEINPCKLPGSGQKPLNPLQLYAFPVPSQTPPHNNILAALLAKHNFKSKNSEVRGLQNRPKTVSNLKKKKKIPTNTIENPDFLDSIPKCVIESAKVKIEILGDYELGIEIGKGSYGVVREGVHLKTREKVAVKIYEKSNLLNPNRMKSVEREIKILYKLKHPNIIELKETVETPTSLNLIFEYVPGCSLLEYLKNRSSRRIEEYQAKVFFKQLMEALSFCHSLDISHRDIKLENILLDEHQNLKLIDFGFSTWISTNRKVQLFCGTSSYMAPEIVSGKESCGPPTDIWAAGVLFFVMVTGTFPFKANTSTELYAKIRTGHFFPPNNISEGARELLKKIFEKDPGRRPTASELNESKWVNSVDKTKSANLKHSQGFIPIFNKTFY